MKINFNFILVSLVFLFFSLLGFFPSSIQAAKQSYIVYLGQHSHGSQPSKLNTKEISDSYYEFLGSFFQSKEKAKEAIFYSYAYDIKGFAAILEDEQVQEISKHPDVVSIFPNEEFYELQTTRSWEFLELEKNGQILSDSLWNKTNFGEDIIVATIDSGVWPESESFNDRGMGPIPKKWRGSCDTDDGVSCNKKLIGVRYFNKGFEARVGHPLDSSYQTGRDKTGHGTHTLSIAGGRFVPDANFLGSARGTAKGGLPNARVASYKVSWPNVTEADVIAAFDAAIHDGVDIVSVSLGAQKGRPYLCDGIAIGALHAVIKGIPVFCGAGNRGIVPRSVTNVGPWIMTVAASTIDRTFPSDVNLGNGSVIKGLSFNTDSSSPSKFYPLIYALDAKASEDISDNAKFCVNGSLSPSKVSGKIVYCESGSINDLEKSWVVARASGIGMILPGRFDPQPQPHFLPSASISPSDGPSVLAYIKSTESPIASISGGTEVGQVNAPAMASVSSVGPNAITPEILKPDITAPGVYILAAYTGAIPATPLPGDDRYLPFNISSGTSMACPHVAGVGGLLKILHPDWSPAAIRSAIMTTAKTLDNEGMPMLDAYGDEATPLNYGSGHIMPNAAADPGLVYDLNPIDYLNFLCSSGYCDLQVQAFNSSFSCPTTETSLLDFNYPSITVPNLSNQVTLTRTLKNVGTPGTYNVSVNFPVGISITINPMSLTFNRLNEEKSFTITVSGNSFDYVFGDMTWTDGVHVVTSPIAVQGAHNVAWTDELHVVTSAANSKKHKTPT